MSDGSTVMFAGTFPSGPASELALFPIATSATVDPFRGDLSRAETWQYEDPATQEDFLYVWDNGGQQFASCSLQSPIVEIETESNDAKKLLIGASLPSPSDAPAGPPRSPLAVVALATPGQGGSDTCTVLAPADVVYAEFSSDSSAIFWLVRPKTGNQQLWTAAADGSGARMIGSAQSISQPHYAVGTKLELELDGDLVWVDTTDPKNQVHTIAEQVFGDAIDLQGSWLVIGYDFSTQDGTGLLGLVNRDTGTQRVIAPEVAQYELGGTTGLWYSTPPNVGTPSWQIAYLVRGRNPSPQDGVWLATISENDLH